MLQKEHIALAFATPISTYLWPDSDELNVALKNVILQKEKDEQGVKRSNVGGWHSKQDLFSWPSDCVGTLKDRVIACTSDMIRIVTKPKSPQLNLQLECWANVARRGNYNAMHDHTAAIWSGVYYVSQGEPDGNDPHNGKLELLDPRVGVNMFGELNTNYLVDPIPGLMVMFPGWLKHMVRPFSGSGERISIAFNAYANVQNAILSGASVKAPS
jgi:uncharacterized protein (TIGR02466 family)